MTKIRLTLFSSTQAHFLRYWHITFSEYTHSLTKKKRKKKKEKKPIRICFLHPVQLCQTTLFYDSLHGYTALTLFIHPMYKNGSGLHFYANSFKPGFPLSSFFFKLSVTNPTREPSFQDKVLYSTEMTKFSIQMPKDSIN